MAEITESATRACPECGVELSPGEHECPSCGCAPCGTGLVDHLPAGEADDRPAPVALVAAGLVAGVAVLAAVAPVAAIAVGACCAAGLAAWWWRRR